MCAKSGLLFACPRCLWYDASYHRATTPRSWCHRTTLLVPWYLHLHLWLCLIVSQVVMEATEGTRRSSTSSSSCLVAKCHERRELGLDALCLTDVAEWVPTSTTDKRCLIFALRCCSFQFCWWAVHTVTTLYKTTAVRGSVRHFELNSSLVPHSSGVLAYYTCCVLHVESLQAVHV